KRLGIRQPLVELFSNDPRLSDLAADVWGPAEPELAVATGTEGRSSAARTAVRKSMGAGRRRRR
ncbi:MAG: hypothetical protein ACRD1D_03430, partial [Acidimicrobiales bacterium]